MTEFYKICDLFIKSFYFASNKIIELWKNFYPEKLLLLRSFKGIGRGIAIKLAEQGANVAFTYLSSVERGQALENELAVLELKQKVTVLMQLILKRLMNL